MNRIKPRCLSSPSARLTVSTETARYFAMSYREIGNVMRLLWPFDKRSVIARRNAPTFFPGGDAAQNHKLRDRFPAAGDRVGSLRWHRDIEAGAEC